MDNKGIKIVGAVILVVVSGVATFITLNTVNPKSASNSSTTSNSDESAATAEAEKRAAATDADKLQAEQQDKTIKELVGFVATGLNNYSVNNRGALPRTASQLTQFVKNYLSDVDFTNPATGAPYQLLLNPSTVSDSSIAYQPGFTCSAEDTSAPAQPGTSRQYALSTILPSGVSYCLGS